MRAASVLAFAALVGLDLACSGCDKDSDQTAGNQTPTYPSHVPGSAAVPTTTYSFELLALDPAGRLAALQRSIVQAGHNCQYATKGEFVGGLDDTDEWRVDCSDSGSWQIWLRSEYPAEIVHCSTASCD